MPLAEEDVARRCRKLSMSNSFLEFHLPLSLVHSPWWCWSKEILMEKTLCGNKVEFLFQLTISLIEQLKKLIRGRYCEDVPPSHSQFKWLALSHFWWGLSEVRGLLAACGFEQLTNAETMFIHYLWTSEDISYSKESQLPSVMESAELIIRSSLCYNDIFDIFRYEDIH